MLAFLVWHTSIAEPVPDLGPVAVRLLCEDLDDRLAEDLLAMLLPGCLAITDAGQAEAPPALVVAQLVLLEVDVPADRSDVALAGLAGQRDDRVRPVFECGGAA